MFENGNKNCENDLEDMFYNIQKLGFETFSLALQSCLYIQLFLLGRNSKPKMTSADVML